MSRKNIIHRAQVAHHAEWYRRQRCRRVAAAKAAFYLEPAY